MNPVEILPVQGTIILRARGSELLILAQHVQALKKIGQPQEFVNYFNNMALINRPARKLFQAWLRKDKGLWRRIYDTVKTIEDGDDATTIEAKEEEAKDIALAKLAEESQKPEKKEGATLADTAEKKDKAPREKTVTKKEGSTKKTATKKTEKKAAAKKTATKKTEKKAATKKTATKKTEKKAATKKATAKKTESKAAAKKTATKKTEKKAATKKTTAKKTAKKKTSKS